MKTLNEVFEKLQESETFKEFEQEHKNFYLAHGFTQLNANAAQAKPWQIGLYSKEQDKLAVFEMSPIKFVGVEEAFKDGGTIIELKDVDEFISSDEAIKTVQSKLKEEYSQEVPTSYLVIVQTINNEPTYNITVITAAFAMISFHIHAIENKIIKVNKQSILDLKKNG